LYIGDEHRKLSYYDQKMPLNNANNYQYHAKVYMGSHKQEMSFVLDTGSSWMWVPGYECPRKECSGTKYTDFMSKTFRGTNRKMDLKYGIGYLEGRISQDSVALRKEETVKGGKKSTAQNVDFLNVYHAQDLKGLVADGLIGMAPRPPPGHPADIFVNELYTQGVISRNIFSMYLGDIYKGQESMAWFGGYDPSFVRKFEGYS